MQYLTIWDLILTPIYLLILIAVAKRYRNKHYPTGHPLRQYFLNGLYAKLGGAIFIALIYQYYYGGGDTYNFFFHSRIINSALSNSVSTWLQLLVRTPTDSNPELYPYAVQMYWYSDPASYMVAAIAAVLGLLNGTSYLPIALLFASISYTGIWAMYRTFTNLYPTLHKQLAIAFLFIPSTFVWGSAVFKDTLCMFGLGWLVYTTFRIFVNRDLSVKNIIMLIVSFYLTAQIKLYILLAFLPALSLWLLMNYSKKIRSAGLRWIINIMFVGITIVAFAFFARRFSNELSKYSLDKIAATATVTRTWTSFAAGDEGSVYDLGEIDGSIGSMMTKFPQAVIVTLFRPFPWEIRKIIVGLSALESLALLVLTLKVFFSNRGKAFREVIRDPNLLFCLSFALIFAFAVGISSGNFGALSRYKIPCLPFYAAMLFVLLGKQTEAKKRPQRRAPVRRLQPAI